MNSFFGKPDSICIEATTDAEGKYTFSKLNRGFIKIDRGDEVCVTNLGMNNSEILNVEKKQIYLQKTVTDSLGNQALSRVELPACRIVSVQDLCEQLVQLSNKNAVGLEWKIAFTDRTTCLFTPKTISARELRIPARMGFSLGLCDLQGRPSPFALLMNSTYNSGGTIILNCHVAADQQRWLSFRVSPNAKSEEFSLVKGVPVCRPLKENIWMYISENSFATLFVNADFINESYVGRERVQAMDVFEYNTFKEGQWVSYAPGNVQWKRVKASSPEELSFEFTTERNKPLSRVDFILYLNFRKNFFY